MEKLIEKKLIEELEKEKNEKIKPDETNINSKNLTLDKINEIYSSNEISSKENITDTMNVHFNMDESSIKILKTKIFKKYKLFNHIIGEFEYKDKNKNLVLNKKSYISSWFKNVDISEIESLIKYNDDLDIHDSQNFYSLFYKYLNSYKDIQLSWNNLEIRTKLMKVYLFHIINHILKRKEEIELNDKIDKIINNPIITDAQKINMELFRSHEDEFLTDYYKKYVDPETKINEDFPDNEDFIVYHKKIKSKYVNEEENNNNNNNKDIIDNSDINIKDQGFTYPKVLILVPYKKHARVIVEEMIGIFSNGDWKGITNKKKFKDEYSEFDSLDDCFRIGINFSYFEGKMKLYSPFDESDIILASPLVLKLASPSDNDKTFKNYKVYDFLSSIEIFLMDFSEIFIYQNLDHLNEILSFMNKQPKNNQNIIDINRIKDNY